MYPNQYPTSSFAPANPSPHNNDAALSLLSILTAASVLLFLYAFVYGPTDLLPYLATLLFVSVRRHLSTVLFVGLIISVLFLIFIGPEVAKNIYFSFYDIFWFFIKILIPTFLVTIGVVFLFKKIKNLHIYYVIIFMSLIYGLMGYMYVHDQNLVVSDQSDIFSLATKEEKIREVNLRYQNLNKICGQYYSMILEGECYVDLERTLENINVRVQTFTPMPITPALDLPVTETP